MDGCKSTSLAAVCRGDLWENFGELQGVVDVPPLPIGFVASPSGGWGRQRRGRADP